MTAAAQLPYDLALNWRGHQVAWKLGGDRRCVTCGRPAFMDNSDSQPQHKTCAELELLHAHGPDGARSIAAAGYPKRGQGRDGAR